MKTESEKFYNKLIMFYVSLYLFGTLLPSVLLIIALDYWLIVLIVAASVSVVLLPFIIFLSHRKSQAKRALKKEFSTGRIIKLTPVLYFSFKVSLACDVKIDNSNEVITTHPVFAPELRKQLKGKEIQIVYDEKLKTAFVKRVIL